MRVEHLLERTIAGYRLSEFLGKGGMGVVFLAQSLEDPQRQAAIKILVNSDIAIAGEFASFKARFQREALAAHQLSHEHILPVLAYGEEENLYYMVMPMLTGGTLAHRLSSAPEGLPLDEASRYLKQLASAIDYAHQSGMVHRDIKPSNILLDEAGNAYLADFGIVHLFDSGQQEFDQELTTLTTTGKIYGTPAYMAPERYKGQQAEPATDIYSLGILLYQLVTGQLPFDADNPLALGMKHLNEEPVVPRLLRPDLPEMAEDAILKAIAKEPADRFLTASDLASAFDTGLKTESAVGVLPATEILAVSLDDATIKRVVPGEVSQVPLVLPQEPEAVSSNFPFALAQTVGNAPAVVRAQPGSRNRLQLIMLGLLGVTLLVFISLLAFAATKFLYPTQPIPAVQPISTDTVPATLLTPSASVGNTPVVKSSPTAAGTKTPASSPKGTPGPSPTASAAPTEPATPSPVPPQPTATAAATPGVTPQATPTAQGTP